LARVAGSRSPIPVLTVFDVAQLHWCDRRRYLGARPPPYA